MCDPSRCHYLLVRTLYAKLPHIQIYDKRQHYIVTNRAIKHIIVRAMLVSLEALAMTSADYCQASIDVESYYRDDEDPPPYLLTVNYCHDYLFDESCIKDRMMKKYLRKWAKTVALFSFIIYKGTTIIIKDSWYIRLSVIEWMILLFFLY